MVVISSILKDNFNYKLGRGICILMSSAILASCTETEDYVAPTAEKAPIASAFSDTPNATSVSRDEKVVWWTKFRDKRLNNLVSQALAQNLDVQQAIERVNVANASVRSVRGAALPNIAIQGVSQREKNSAGDILSEKGVGVGGAWTIDITGKNRRNLSSALAQLEASEANIVATKLVMVGDLVQTYIRMRGAQAEAQIARDAVAETRRITDLTQEQFDSGVVSALEVQLAQGRVNEAKQDIPNALINFEVELAHLATLLSVPVADIKKDLIRGARQPIGRGNVSIGVPADLLRNRYDIRAAERIVAASFEQIGVAEADLLPSLTLSGSIVGASGIDVWQFGPQLTLPILNRTAIRSKIKVARSVAEQSYLTWKQTILNAVEQVEAAQARRTREQESLTYARRNVAHLINAQKLALQSYESGVLPLQQLIDINRMLSNSRTSLAKAHTAFGLAYVDLQLALGGYIE